MSNVPRAGLCVTVGDGLQLSDSDAALYTPTLPWQLALAFTVAFGGQAIEGGVTSLRVTVNVHELVLPLPSLAVSVTIRAVLCPKSNVPEAGLCVIVGDGLQLSESETAE